MEQVQKAYIYLVKAPGNNDVSICASDSVFYPGTYVIFPTRYGQDMGIIIGSAADLGKENYTKGCACVRGACHFCPTKQADNSDLVAEGDPITMGIAPSFEFVSSMEIPVPEETEPDESGIWDPQYKEPRLVEVDGDIDWIKAMATPDEIRRYQENIEAEKEAIKICKEKIAQRKLEMKLVTAHFLISEPKALFFFTAEDRVDFRELVKDLVSVFRMRIELRQIGVRDEARVLGGLAVCGRDFCCHSISDKLDPVTIKMAKEQNMSLNSMKISGPCGRLLCCLSYEYDFYVEEKQSYPPEGSKIKIGDELYRVQEVNILSRSMTLSGSEGRTFSVPRSQVRWSERTGHWEVSREFEAEFLG
jgi:cell fate regulator YaaT (PSP1 superfamily)